MADAAAWDALGARSYGFFVPQFRQVMIVGSAAMR
jgi:hypothetical protein